MASWNESYALCPFYDTDEKNSITCETIFLSGRKTKHNFVSNSAKQEHLIRFCNRDYKKCPYHRALTGEKYK